MSENYFQYIIKVKVNMSEQRVDQFIQKYFSEHSKDEHLLDISLSRSRIQKFIKEKIIMVNHKPVKQNYIIQTGDSIFIRIPKEYGEQLPLEPQNIPLDIIYDDQDLVLINKPAGLVVHPAAGHYSHTLINGLIYHFPELQKNTNLARTGLVHRLDKDTSGILLITKNEFTQQNIIEQFKSHTINKEYIALVYGHLDKQDGEIANRIGRNPIDRKKMAVLMTQGKESLTYYHVMEYLNQCTFVKLVPRTGRTHQLRVHMHYLKHPILGDPIYCKTKHEFFNLGLMLCAKKIKFYHPRLDKEMEFEIDIPERFKIIINHGGI